MKNPFHIGDTVTISNSGMWDGTVVDAWDDVIRVYWRFPLGKVSDYHTDELVRKV